MSKKTPRVSVQDTHKYGKGVFAGENIEKGRLIHTFTGDIISFEECIKRIKAGKESQDDSFQVELEMDMDLDRLSNSFNHSCNPNAGHRKVSDLIAIKNIKKGEEITYDYSATVGPNIPKSIWGMRCNCGSKNCRKIIHNVLTIPEKQLKKYRRAGTLQDYIRRELRVIFKNGGILPRYNKIKL